MKGEGVSAPILSKKVRWEKGLTDIRINAGNVGRHHELHVKWLVADWAIIGSHLVLVLHCHRVVVALLLVADVIVEPLKTGHVILATLRLIHLWVLRVLRIWWFYAQSLRRSSVVVWVVRSLRRTWFYRVSEMACSFMIKIYKSWLLL